MADPNLMLDIDVTDPTYRILAAFGGRLDALLKKPKVPADDNLAGTLDEFLVLPESPWVTGIRVIREAAKN